MYVNYLAGAITSAIKLTILTLKYFKRHMYTSLYILHTLNKRQSFSCEVELCLFNIQSALYFDPNYQSVLQQTHYIYFIKWLGWSLTEVLSAWQADIHHQGTLDTCFLPETDFSTPVIGCISLDVNQKHFETANDPIVLCISTTKGKPHTFLWMGYRGIQGNCFIILLPYNGL